MANLRTETVQELERRLSQTNSLIKICQAQIEVSKISQTAAVRPEDRQTIAQAIERLDEDLLKNKTTLKALQDEIARRNAMAMLPTHPSNLAVWPPIDLQDLTVLS